MSTQTPSTPKSWALALIAAAQLTVIMNTLHHRHRATENADPTPVLAGESDLGVQRLRHRLRPPAPARRTPVRPVRAKRIFATGWLVLLAGSITAGAAGNVGTELAGRAVQGAGGTAHVFLGEVITEYLSWPWVFYINIPIAVVALATPLVMPTAPARSGSVDILGALTITAGLTLASTASPDTPYATATRNPPRRSRLVGNRT